MSDEQNIQSLMAKWRNLRFFPPKRLWGYFVGLLSGLGGIYTLVGGFSLAGQTNNPTIWNNLAFIVTNEWRELFSIVVGSALFAAAGSAALALWRMRQTAESLIAKLNDADLTLVIQSDTENQKSLREAVARTLSKIPSFPDNSVTKEAVVVEGEEIDKRQYQRMISHVVLEFWYVCGLLSRSTSGQYSPQSQHSAAFLQSLGLSIKQNVPFLDDWSVSHSDMQSYSKCTNLTKLCETYRRENTAKEHWVRVRSDIPSTIVLVKRNWQGSNELLMRWSEPWSCWAWIGGLVDIEEAEESEAGAFRELHEETGIKSQRQSSQVLAP